ncbi:unnamed protein product [Oikopleura dioica]|uniref:Uncharacterized protein n=1 Tax=Oikopleura dioica TaxID=34765 RepID=E4YXT4_OIKDI|nr:unnamed protein product [Oikopleura dioica]
MELHLIQKNTQCLWKEETPLPNRRFIEARTTGKNQTSSPARLSIISTNEHKRKNRKSSVLTLPYTSYNTRNTSRTPPTITTSHTSTLSLLVLFTQKQQTLSPSRR